MTSEERSFTHCPPRPKVPFLVLPLCSLHRCPPVWHGWKPQLFPRLFPHSKERTSLQMLTDDLRKQHPSPSPKPSLASPPPWRQPPHWAYAPIFHVLLQTATTVTSLERSLLMANEALAESGNKIQSHVASQIICEMISRLLSGTCCARPSLKNLAL